MDKKRAAVLGFPVNHSLSPRLHQYWLKQYGIDGIYEAIAVEPDDLRDKLRDLAAQGYMGVNLTIPHKEMAVKCVDMISEHARGIGAVNTVVMKDGKLKGLNTDAYGFTANLKATLHNVRPTKALVLGSGGAARAICAGLKLEGWNITIAARDPGNAHAIANRYFGTTVVRWEDAGREMHDTALLVNATPLGMKGQEPLGMRLDTLPKEAFVYDVVYLPAMTELLTEAKARGNTIIGGLGMLLYQAQPAFEEFFGVRPEVTQDVIAYVSEGLR